MSRSQIAKDNLWNAGLERVMGYFRPVSGYNKGKKSEFEERVWFTEEMACRCNHEEKVA